MSKLFAAILLATISSTSVMATCSKDQAKSAVEKICKSIETSGKGALKEVKSFRYCGNNYVWVQDSNVKMVSHPIKPRLNKKSLKKHKDENGKLLFVEFDKKAQSTAEGGWVDYVWPRPGAEKATPKLSFVKKCAGELGWVVGSGIWK